MPLFQYPARFRYFIAVSPTVPPVESLCTLCGKASSDLAVQCAATARSKRDRPSLRPAHLETELLIRVEQTSDCLVASARRGPAKTAHNRGEDPRAARGVCFTTDRGTVHFQVRSSGGMANFGYQFTP